MRRRKPEHIFVFSGVLFALYGLGLWAQSGSRVALIIVAIGLVLADGGYRFRWTRKVVTLGFTGIVLTARTSARGFYRLLTGRRRPVGGTDLRTILLMSSLRFEQFCADLLEREGYKVMLTAPTGDAGVDVEFRAPSGALGLAQARRWAHTPVGRPVVQQLYGEMTHEGAAMGYVITTSRFTREAVEWATGKRIGLIDGAELELLATKYFGRIELKTADILPLRGHRRSGSLVG